MLNENLAALIKYETITQIKPDSDISAGTIGTRGAQKTISYNKPSGYEIIGVMVTYMYNSSAIIPIVFMSGSNMYLNWYRATSSSISKQDAEVYVKVTYAKAMSV